jgi:hypothetical protein
MGFSLQCTVTRIDPEDHQRLRIVVYKTSKYLDALRLKYVTFEHILCFSICSPFWAYIYYVRVRNVFKNSFERVVNLWNEKNLNQRKAVV